MRQRVFCGLGAIWLALCAAFVAGTALAQQGTVVSFSARTTEISSVLERGQQLEVERRWAEALTHYEDAIRLYPAESNLQRHFEYSRMHYDLGRRYADRSFCQSLGQMPLGKALELYTQVLLKIQSHYVEPPNWKNLFDHGTSNFDVALTEPVFVERNLQHCERATVDAFRRELYGALAARTVLDRNDARDAVAVAAQLAQQRLHLQPATVVLEYLCGATNSLDPYSTYLTPDQLNEVYSQIDGNFVGLGVELKAQEGALAIVRVIPGSPAEQSGVHIGDRIVSVDGHPTQDLTTDQAANLLQGEEGSIARLALAARDAPVRQVSIRRQRVNVPSVDQVEIVDRPDCPRTAGVAYFKLVCFQNTTCREMEAALWKLYRAGMKTLVIDLRGNPGGVLMSGVEVADKFVDHGVIVSTHGRNSQEDVTYSAHGEGVWRVPLVVLIDGNSASAAEIFAGAIRDHHRGVIVGVRSYGKGTVQGIFPLDVCNAGIRLTLAKFYSPTGRPYSGVGVEPDVPVQTTARPVDGNIVATEAKDEVMLAAALREARKFTQQQQARSVAQQR